MLSLGNLSPSFFSKKQAVTSIRGQSILILENSKGQKLDVGTSQ